MRGCPSQGGSGTPSASTSCSSAPRGGRPARFIRHEASLAIAAEFGTASRGELRAVKRSPSRTSHGELGSPRRRRQACGLETEGLWKCGEDSAAALGYVTRPSPTPHEVACTCRSATCRCSTSWRPRSDRGRSRPPPRAAPRRPRPGAPRPPTQHGARRGPRGFYPQLLDIGERRRPGHGQHDAARRRRRFPPSPPPGSRRPQAALDQADGASRSPPQPRNRSLGAGVKWSDVLLGEVSATRSRPRRTGRRGATRSAVADGRGERPCARALAQAAGAAAAPARGDHRLVGLCEAPRHPVTVGGGRAR